MKVVAGIDPLHRGYHDDRILVEMTVGEFVRVTGHDVRAIRVDATADPVKLFELLENVRDRMKSAERSIGSFRALADLVEQCVDQAKVAVNENARPAVETAEVQP